MYVCYRAGHGKETLGSWSSANVGTRDIICGTISALPKVHMAESFAPKSEDVCLQRPPGEMK